MIGCILAGSERPDSIQSRRAPSIGEADCWPAELDLADNPRWRGLQIVETVAGGPDDDRGIVEFRATYLVPGGGVEIMQERSEFVREGGRWYYLRAV